MSRNTLLLVVVFGSFANTGSCQDQRVIDSLQAVIKGSSGAEEYDAWHWLVTEYVDLDNQKALQLMKLAEEAAYDSGDTLSIIKSQRLKAQILFRLERTRDVMSTLHNLENKMPLWRFPDERVTILNLFGVCYLVMSKFDKSLNYFFQTYERSKEAEDEQYEIVSIKNIGVVYYKLKDYRKALQYMKQGTALELDQGRRNCMSSMNISLCYTHLADFDSAKIYLDQSIEFCGSDCGLQPMTHIHYAAGCMQLGLNEVSSAKDEFLKSLNYSRKMEDVRMQLDNIYLLSKIFIGENDLVSAEKFLKVGESIIRQGIPYNMEMIKVYEQMSELYLAMKRYEMASHYQSMYIVLRDSIYNEALTTNLMRIESSFLEQENQAKIIEQDKTILLNAEIIDHQRTLNILSTLVALMAVVIIITFYRTYRRNVAVNTLLDRKVKERTDQLEANRQELMSALHEKDLMLRRLSSTIGEKINTVKGLCFVARGEVIDPVALDYVDKIGDTSMQMEECLRTVGKDDGVSKT